jgi:hypothetical protein
VLSTWNFKEKKRKKRSKWVDIFSPPWCMRRKEYWRDVNAYF